MNVIQRDNVLQHPLAVRDFVLSFKDQFKVEDHGGVHYPGMLRNAGLSLWMQAILCPLIGELIGAQSITPGMSFFRLDDGVKHDLYIHSDQNMVFSNAAILNLTLPEHCAGGTAFWKHRASGLCSQPIGAEFAEMAKFLSFVEGRDETKWDMLQVVEHAFNRLIIFDGRTYHSRFPKDCPQTEMQNGRLTWVCFFKTP